MPRCYKTTYAPSAVSNKKNKLASQTRLAPHLRYAGGTIRDPPSRKRVGLKPWLAKCIMSDVSQTEAVSSFRSSFLMFLGLPESPDPDEALSATIFYIILLKAFKFRSG
ncbi:hypothetical protein CEXT_685741 [Caerostris extrusa]|uniref:Uncharacterized protein n=1 Tax=Caerostris extrusa TaxID=172846 RepID=A0AAV4TEU3_CAEEX|nr:hypothetical protein CEXT_685741 [Caerostris extrusa]